MYSINKLSNKHLWYLFKDAAFHFANEVYIWSLYLGGNYTDVEDKQGDRCVKKHLSFAGFISSFHVYQKRKLKTFRKTFKFVWVLRPFILWWNMNDITFPDNRYFKEGNYFFKCLYKPIWLNWDISFSNLIVRCKRFSCMCYDYIYAVSVILYLSVMYFI